jgi:hypothetical protein
MVVMVALRFFPGATPRKDIAEIMVGGAYPIFLCQRIPRRMTLFGRQKWHDDKIVKTLRFHALQA